MNWTRYLERIRYAFGEQTELADAYCDGYEDRIRARPRREEHAQGVHTGFNWEAYRQGYQDAENDQ